MRTRWPKPILWIAGVVLLAAVAAHLSAAMAGSPMDAVRAEASQLGWDPDDLITIAGGHSSRWLSWSAYGRFRSRSKPEIDEIYIRVVRSAPLIGWRLAEYRQS